MLQHPSGGFLNGRSTARERPFLFIMTSKNSLYTHKNFLRKLIKDERLQPSRRMLAEMLLLYIEDYVPFDFLEAIYTNKKKVDFNTKEGSPEESVKDKVHNEAAAKLKEIFASLGEENANNNTTSS